MPLIREYEERDARGLEECFIELQDYEGRIDPYLADSQSVLKSYLEYMFNRGAESSGKVFVAEVDERVAGFISVWAKVKSRGIEEKEYEYAYISDLVVLPAHRSLGLGRALLQRAEDYARGQGAEVLRIGVMAKNEGARRLYRSYGFEDRLIEMSKSL